MQKNTFREGRVNTLLHKTIAEFLKETANIKPFITISYICLNPRGTTAKVYCSVFPKEHKKQAFLFLKRKEPLCRAYVHKHTSLRITPTIRFMPTKEI